MLNHGTVDLVLHIDVPDEVIAERMVNRRVHEPRFACPNTLILDNTLKCLGRNTQRLDHTTAQTHKTPVPSIDTTFS